MLDIVIPCANEPKYLARMLESIGKQIKDKSLIQIYIVDDCTEYEDRYKLELGKFGNKYGMADGKSIFYIRNEKRLGPGGSRNKGIEAGEDEFICFWDDDDYIINDPILILNNDFDIYQTNVNNFAGNSYFNLINPVWNLIFKREFLERNNLKFLEIKEGTEDSVFKVISFCSTDKIANIKDFYYYYHDIRPDSCFIRKINIDIDKTKKYDKNLIKTIMTIGDISWVSFLYKEFLKKSNNIDCTEKLLKVLENYTNKFLFCENKNLGFDGLLLIFSLLNYYCNTDILLKQDKNLLFYLSLFSKRYCSFDSNKEIMKINLNSLYLQSKNIDKIIFKEIGKFINNFIDNRCTFYFDIGSISKIYIEYQYENYLNQSFIKVEKFS